MTRKRSMKALEVHLKSGTTFTVDATDVSITRNRVTNEIQEIGWTTPDDARAKLFMLDPDDVSALVVIR